MDSEFQGNVIFGTNIAHRPEHEFFCFFSCFLVIKGPLSTNDQDALFFLLPYDPLVFPVFIAMGSCFSDYSFNLS